jgi:hypothetical protein
LPTGEDTSVRISVLGSGSGGNATLIATERTRVLLDAGFSRRETQKRLRAIGEPADALDAIVISHEHSDHISGMVSLAGGLHVPVYMTELARRVVPADPAEVRVMPHFELFRAGQTLAINDIEIETFTIPHDSVDPVAFRIQAEGVRVGFCTDLGYIPDSVKVHLRGCHCLILESTDISVDESVLTGETYPAEKEAGTLPVDTLLARRNNCAFLGTHVSSGTATALVVRTGRSTEFGAISEHLRRLRFDLSVNSPLVRLQLRPFTRWRPEAQPRPARHSVFPDRPASCEPRASAAIRPPAPRGPATDPPVRPGWC